MPAKARLVLGLRVAAALAIIISLVVFVPWSIVWVWLPPLPDTVQEQADDAVKHGLDGIIVYVDRAGHEPVHYTAGWKNRDTKTPADPDAFFKIASIGKLYVAAAAVRLAHDERVSLDDTLAGHFPDLVDRIENADRITLRLMLQHRSGIPNLTDHPDFPWGDPPQTSREALEYALDHPADFEPSEGYAYSNTNYLLIAQMIEQVTGDTLDRFIRDELLSPLGLSQTYFSMDEVDADDIMSGYHVGWGPDVKGNHHGSMIVTASDVGVFLRALNDGTLFTPEEQATYASVYEFEHTGLVPGYSSIARYHQDLDAVVIQFVNTSGGDTWTITEVVYDRIVRILRNQADAAARQVHLREPGVRGGGRARTRPRT